MLENGMWVKISSQKQKIEEGSIASMNDQED